MNLETLILPLKTEDSGFRAGLSRAIQLVEGFVALADKAIKATFQWADELDSLQDITGVTNRTAAALNFTLRKSGVETGTLTRAFTILNKGLVDAHGRLDTTGKSLKRWGVNVLDTNGKLKDQETLIREVAARYGELGTQQEKVNFLTEVFGRSGAELIDFFDTLSADGGIDAVTKKVAALGLAIDPNRYEQFNRNLEELKLIGLGLAVQFTEKVMPTLEHFLSWFNSFVQNPSVSKAFEKLDTFVGSLVEGMADGIDDWVASGGPEELSEKIISWVDKIGTGEGIQSKAVTAMGHLLNALIEAAKGIDWVGITDTIDAKLAEVVSGHDWQTSGDAFGDAIANMFSQSAVEGMKGKDSEAIPAIGNALKAWFVGAAGPENIAAFSNLFQTALSTAISTATQFSSQTAMQKGQDISRYLTNGFLAGSPFFAGALSQLELLLEQKLREIAKVFFARALGWAQQAIQGFNSGVGGLLSAIGGIVNAINGVLRKIITTFNISVNFLPINSGAVGSMTTLGGATVPATVPATTTGTTSGGNRPRGGRASGGPVIGGQLYGFNMDDEWFVPNQNGRVEKKQDDRPPIEIDYNRMGSVIATEVVKALNNR